MRRHLAQVLRRAANRLDPPTHPVITLNIDGSKHGCGPKSLISEVAWRLATGAADTEASA